MPFARSSLTVLHPILGRLQKRSLRALRKLLLAFRSAASTGAATAEEVGERYEIQSPAGE